TAERARKRNGTPTTKPVGDLGGRPATMAHVEEVAVVVAHHERATLRVGDVFLKIDGDQANTDVEVEAMRRAPIPTPEVLWRRPPVLALAALPGTALGRLGEPSTTPPAAWAAAGGAARAPRVAPPPPPRAGWGGGCPAVRARHDAPLPPWPAKSLDEKAASLETE